MMMRVMRVMMRMTGADAGVKRDDDDESDDDDDDDWC